MFANVYADTFYIESFGYLSKTASNQNLWVFLRFSSLALCLQKYGYIEIIQRAFFHRSLLSPPCLQITPATTNSPIPIFLSLHEPQKLSSHNRYSLNYRY